MRWQTETDSSRRRNKVMSAPCTLCVTKRLQRALLLNRLSRQRAPSIRFYEFNRGGHGRPGRNKTGNVK